MAHYTILQTRIVNCHLLVRIFCGCMETGLDPKPLLTDSWILLSCSFPLSIISLSLYIETDIYRYMYIDMYNLHDCHTHFFPETQCCDSLKDS